MLNGNTANDSAYHYFLWKLIKNFNSLILKPIDKDYEKVEGGYLYFILVVWFPSMQLSKMVSIQIFLDLLKNSGIK